MPELFSIAPWRTVHDIHATTRKKRRFVVDIYCDDHKREDLKRYETTVTVSEINSAAGWVFNVRTLARHPEEHFKAALEWILDYLKHVDPTDAIDNIHNPCNCPFVSEVDQVAIASKLGITAAFRVNQDPFRTKSNARVPFRALKIKTRNSTLEIMC